MFSGRVLCDELITRPEESYRLCCVVVCDLERSRMGAPYIYIYIYDISRLRVKDLYSSPNIVRVIKSRSIRGARHERVLGRREAYKGFLWGKPEGKRPLGRPRRKREDDIKKDLQEVGCGSMDWIDLT